MSALVPALVFRSGYVTPRRISTLVARCPASRPYERVAAMRGMSHSQV
ncbi:hypothetical protein [Bradyrhizobium sp.]